MRPFVVWSLNGERFAGNTPTEIPSTLTWLKGLSQPGAIVPDVLCLQDVRVSVLQHLGPLPHIAFAPMTKHNFWGERELLGICIASQWPIDNINIHHSWGDGIVRDLEGVGEDQQRIQPYEISDALILKTQNRVAIACSIQRPDDGESIRVATHHGFWVRDGVHTENQLASTASVCGFLAAQGCKYGGLIYAADYNPDKEGCVLRTYVESGARDYLPQEIKTTLAPHHPAAKFGIRSDCAMVWPDSSGKYNDVLKNIHLDETPGSDHLMLCFNATRD